MNKLSHGPQGFPTDKVMKTVVRGYLPPEDLDLIRGILTLEQKELDTDEMAEVIATVEGVTVELASILVSSWYDAGKNKMDWEDKELNHWIMAVLTPKMAMNRFDMIATKIVDEKKLWRGDFQQKLLSSHGLRIKDINKENTWRRRYT